MEHKRLPFNKDMVIGIILFSFFLFAFIESFGIKTIAASAIGADFFPRLVSIFGMVLSILIFKGGVLVFRSRDKKLEVSEEAAGGEGNLYDTAVVIITILLSFLYMLIFNTLGYIFSSILYMIIQAFLMTPDEKKRSIKNGILIIVISVSVPVGVFLFFRYIFYLMLPVGSLFYSLTI